MQTFAQSKEARGNEISRIDIWYLMFAIMDID